MPNEQERQGSPNRRPMHMTNDQFQRLAQSNLGGGLVSGHHSGSTLHNFSEPGGGQHSGGGRTFQIPPAIGYSGMSPSVVYDTLHHQTSSTSHASGMSAGAAGGATEVRPATLLHPSQLSALTSAASSSAAGGHGGMQAWLSTTLTAAHEMASLPHAVAMNPGEVQQNYQRLKVEDALSYLDKVKLQFAPEPQVYNDFLDIMKEFKSQQIDTPGVIHRVSTLFRGHNSLIEGFNTFLPAGYKIEVQNDVINVHQPGQGVMTMIDTGYGPSLVSGGSMGLSGALSHPPNISARHASMDMGLQRGTVPPPLPLGIQGQLPHHVLPSCTALQQATLQQLQLQMQTGTGYMGTTQPNQPVEFNHAIHYVNKIKSRYSRRPEIYKQFLEILHTYQKEQKNIKDGVPLTGKPLTEAEVYARVQRLFMDDPDLLNEFGQFLPDANNGSTGLMSGLGAEWALGGLKCERVSMPPAASVPPPSVAVKRRTGGTDMHSPAGRRASTSNGSQALKKPKLEPMLEEVKEEVIEDQPLTPCFFFRIQAVLDNDEMYADLENAWTLYSERINNYNAPSFSGAPSSLLPSPALISLTKHAKELAAYCLTSTPDAFHEELQRRLPELTKAIRRSVRENPELKERRRERYLESAEGMPLETNDDGGNFNQRQPMAKAGGNKEIQFDICDLSTCPKLHESYRVLPENLERPKCTGQEDVRWKDEVCELNDSYRSYSHLREFPVIVLNDYEENLAKLEDERYEWDMVIEPTVHAIKVLTETKLKLPLIAGCDDPSKHTLSGPLADMNERLLLGTIERLYGPEKATDILKGIKLSPAVVIPTVVSRMEEKVKEWRMSQVQSLPHWREIFDTNYSRSLDGLSADGFKVFDVKEIESKSIADAIAVATEKWQAGGSVGDIPLDTLHCPDTCSLEDTVSLILVIFNKQQTGIQPEDRARVKTFLTEFLPDLLSISRERLNSVVENDDREAAENDVKEVKPSRTTTTVGLASAQEAARPTVHNVASAADTTAAPSVLYANNSLRFFLMLFSRLCTRMEGLRQVARRMLEEEEADVPLQNEFTAQARDIFLANTNAVPMRTRYEQFLELTRLLINGEAEGYDEKMNDMFCGNGYLWAAIDKHFHHINKLLRTICVNTDCVKLQDQFMNYNRTRFTPADEEEKKSVRLCYRLSARQIAEGSLDDHCYEINVTKIANQKAGPGWDMSVHLLHNSNVPISPVMKKKKKRSLKDETDSGLAKRCKVKQSSGSNSDVNVSRQRSENKVAGSPNPFFLERNLRRSRNRSMSPELLARVERLTDTDMDQKYLPCMAMTVMPCPAPYARVSFLERLSFEHWKCGYLSRAKQNHKAVSQKMYGGFTRWLSKKDQNVDPEKSADWKKKLLGKEEGMNEGCVTKIRVIETSTDVSPYRVYSKYTTEVTAPTGDARTGVTRAGVSSVDDEEMIGSASIPGLE